MTNSISLIVGLGNPGNQYEQTRHNAGFWFVDQLAKIANTELKPDKKFFGDYAQIRLGKHEIKLLKPTLFMNRSGQSVAALANFYKIPVKNILVAHDELDFPVGKIRLKLGGGHGGHNGLRDIISHLGKNSFMRLRIGIDHPGSSHQVTGYVLGKPSVDDRIAIDASIESAIEITELLASGETQKATQTLHRS